MVLKLPEAGLELESSARSMATLPLQAFAITLDDDILEDMIESFQNGKGIELSLGQSPAFIYGSETHHIKRTPDSFCYDIYVTDPKAPTTADLLPNPTMPIFRNPALNKLRYTAPLSRRAASEEDGDDVLEIVNHPDYQAKPSKSNSSTLQPNALKSMPGAKKTVVSSKSSAFTMSTSALSRASSPALSMVGSPMESSVESASQQKVKDAREQRAPITHLLAVREMTYDELWEKWGGSEDSKKEFRGILDKVADVDKSTGKYTMKKMYYKELDIWNHEYDSESDRQLAIDNTARWYDRLRIGPTEPVWQKLLPFDERGKGKSLSKLQATLAKGPKTMTSTPKINVQKADDSTSAMTSPGTRDDETRSIISSEPMSRSSSQTKTTKKAVPDLSVAAVKKPAAPKKASTPKVSPVKAAAASKPAAKPANGGRGPLSKELISDSDDSSEEIPLSQQLKQQQAKKQQLAAAPKPAVAPRPAAVPRPAKVSAVRAPAAVAPKAKPLVKEPLEPQTTARPVKRPREEEDSSSSSGATPLMKKAKARELKAAATLSKDVGAGSRPKEVPKQAEKLKEQRRELKPVPTATPTTKARAPEATSGRGTTTSSNGSLNQTKPKNTSPPKSSPLASSPPTNASDIDPAEEALIASANNKKRKAVDAYNDSSSSGSSAAGSMPRVKRQQQQQQHLASGSMSGSKLPESVMDTARRFKTYYEKYEQLHYRLLELENPEQTQISTLTKMRNRLEEMKREIYAGTRRGRNGSESDAVDRR
ncbi:hypothetical protein MAPG_00374 [Magnaporthiopsis poae ATCC 64411]|uniref:E3 ubiquitin-protein ligase UBR1-like winged-helix domain-containing protein n=1 Tax=Magnaporthiopsis poae (strain ATCC 64411 / 73-15) TaxID=644358 RepID=A0A0C4DKU4_MAGP6|nr:hypothetical protein MAPG_00374 [Magnaporthiopsis poae ATCC 64411]